MGERESVREKEKEGKRDCEVGRKRDRQIDRGRGKETDRQVQRAKTPTIWHYVQFNVMSGIPGFR